MKRLLQGDGHSDNNRRLRRLIGIHYLLHKAVSKAYQSSPHTRHLRLKIFYSRPHVLGLIVGVNFFHDAERLDKKQLVAVVQDLIPDIQPVNDSFFALKMGEGNVCTLYLEFVRPQGVSYTKEEVTLLRKELPDDFKARIAYLLPPIFMPRNEEEIMRNILSLSGQIKYLRDIPQVSIAFDEQTQDSLFFTVIVIRIVKPGMASVQELFEGSSSLLEYIPDRSRAVGFVRKKYTKEATVFRLKMGKEPFLRRDHSIDLVKARQRICFELGTMLGEFRDFNGGMMSKQGEKLVEVKKIACKSAKYDEFLLENYFYSLNPVVMRTLLEPDVLYQGYVMLSELSSKRENTGIATKHTKDFVYLAIECQRHNSVEEINRILNKFHLHSSDLASGILTIKDKQYLSYIYRCDHPSKQHQFCQMLQKGINEKNTESRMPNTEDGL